MKSNKAFYIGAIFWEEFKDKALALKEVQAKLNEHIDLSKYGHGLKTIVFVPIAVRPSNTIHEEEIKYSSDKKEISLCLKMDFEEVSQADKDDFLKLFADLYVKAIDQFSDHKVKSFNSNRFKKDVIKLFGANGWLLPVKQS